MVFHWPDKVILIAEDEDMNYKFLEKVLQETQVKIIRAHNGKEAIDIISKSPKIDLVLMDLRMPEMDGFDATIQIKKNYNLPVIAQTAYAVEGGKEKGLEAGCDEYIVKPINISKILAVIDKYLSKNHESKV